VFDLKQCHNEIWKRFLLNQTQQQQQQTLPQQPQTINNGQPPQLHKPTPMQYIPKSASVPQTQPPPPQHASVPHYQQQQNQKFR